MTIKLEMPRLKELKPRITVMGIGGAGGNAINNMIAAGLDGVHFVAANTDAQALVQSSAQSCIQLGASLTEGLGAGSKPEVGAAAAEEALEEIRGHIAGSHMLFIAAGMGGGTGSGAASVVARVARDMDMLVVAIVTKPFHFEGTRRMRIADAAIAELRQYVDTMIVIPNQNLFRVASEKTTFSEAFLLADQVLYSGIACIVDLVIKEGLINLDFADVRTVMKDMGAAMMGTGEASGADRALRAAEEAIANPLLEEVSMGGARGLLLSITGSRNLTLFEVDQAASRVRQEVDPEANIIVGATFDENLGDRIRVSIVASGMPHAATQGTRPPPLPTARAIPPRPPASPPPSHQMAPPAIRGGADLSAEILQQKLSEAMQGPGAEFAPSAQANHAAAASHAASTWQAPGGVVIEPTNEMPRQANDGAATRTQGTPSYVGTFTAAPPTEVRPGGRRIPDLAEFPEVAQREYMAKTGEATGPREVADARRPGLLRRLATSLSSGGNDDSPDEETVRYDSQASGGNHTAQQHGDIRASRGQGATNVATEGRTNVEKLDRNKSSKR